MPDYVLKNEKTGGVYVLSLPNGADDDYRAEALAPFEAAGWALDTSTDPAEVPPPIQQPPVAVPFEASSDFDQSTPDVAPEPEPARARTATSKEIS